MSTGDRPRDIGTSAATATDELDLLRRRLANVIGHALRTPAATVRGNAEILAACDDPDVSAQALDGLRRTARRLEEMIDEVLVVEGIGTRLPTAASQALVVADEVRAVADDLEVVDEVEVVGDTDARVLAGRDALRWVLRSVLDNAGRYGQGRVRVAVADDGRRVRVAVSTPEGGAPATDDDLRLAFEPFYRGERAVTVTASRLGLGLTVARRLVEEVGGAIHLERDEGHGVVTVMELPRA